MSSINGYSNPYRSTTLTKMLSDLSDKEEKVGSHGRLWEGWKPAWNQHESTMHCVGKLLITASIALGAATVAGALFYSGRLLNAYPIYQHNMVLTVSIIGGTSTVVTLVVGIYYHKKSYYEDPAYLQKRREHIFEQLIRHGYDHVKAEHGQEYTHYELCTEAEMSHILAKTHLEGNSYLALLNSKKNNLSQMIKDGIISIESLHQLIMNEAQGLPFSQFIQTYGWQPFADGVVNANSQFADGTTFRTRFIFETQTLNFDTIFQTYKKNGGFWKLFDYGLVSPQEMHSKALLALQNPSVSFSSFINTYGWSVFDYKILTNLDIPVIDKIIAYIKMKDVTEFLEADYEKALKNHLIPPLWATEMGNFYRDYTEARKKYEEAKAKAESKYEETRERLEKQKEAVLGPLRLQVRASVAITGASTLNNLNAQKSGSAMQVVATGIEHYHNTNSLGNATRDLAGATAEQNRILQKGLQEADGEKQKTINKAQEEFDEVKHEINVRLAPHLFKVTKPY